MTLTKSSDLTLRPPRITFERFHEILTDRKSPAVTEAEDIWGLLVDGGVDPSFALGQYHVESLMGKSGHATVTHSWGNMLWDANLTPTRAKYSPGNGYTYALYPNWTEGVRDYVKYTKHYSTTVVRKYSDTFCDTIAEHCERWQGDAQPADHKSSYVQIILHEMNDIYEYVPGVYVPAGDLMIAIDASKVTTNKRYPVKNGTPLYRGTDGDVLKLASFASRLPDGSLGGVCRFLGPVGATASWTDPLWAWGAVIVNVSGMGERVVYIKTPIKTRVTTV
jgi:hypothetical protein